jgi:hypothetical protein
MTIRTESELLSIFSDNVNRDITPQDLRDLVDSLVAVGGTMFANAKPIALAGGWEEFAWFDQSIDTKGLAEDLLLGHFTVQTGADGLYAVDTTVSLSSQAPGTLQLAITKNGSLTPYRVKRDVSANDTGSVSITATGPVIAGDTIGLAINAQGAANVDLEFAQFRAIRV